MRRDRPEGRPLSARSVRIGVSDDDGFSIGPSYDRKVYAMSPLAYSWPPSDADLALTIAARQWIKTHGAPEAPYSSLGNPFLHAAESAFFDAAGDLLGENWKTDEPPRPPLTDEVRERRRVTSDVRLRIFERDGYECRSCEANSSLEIDHVIPISRGGSSDDDNLQVLCASCNRSKGTKTLEEWGGRR